MVSLAKRRMVDMEVQGREGIYNETVRGLESVGEAGAKGTFGWVGSGIILVTGTMWSGDEENSETSLMCAWSTWNAAEAMAFTEALCFALELGFQDIEVEGDAKGVVMAIRGDDEDLSFVGNLIDEA